MSMFCNVSCLVLHEPHSTFTLLRPSIWLWHPDRGNCGCLYPYPASGYALTNSNKFQMQALHDVVKAGYVRYIGMSSCWAWQCTYRCMCRKTSAYNFVYLCSPCNAKWVHWSFRRERSDYRSRLRDQQQFNTIHLDAKPLQFDLSGRGARNDPYPQGGNSITHLPSFTFINWLKHFGVGSIPWSPLARGLLTRPFISKNDTARGKTDKCVLIQRPELTKLNHLVSQDD